MKEYFENVYAMIYCGYEKHEGEGSGHVRAVTIMAIVYVVTPVMVLMGYYAAIIDPTFFLSIHDTIPYRRTGKIIWSLIVTSPILYIIYRYYSPKIKTITKRWCAKENKKLRCRTRLYFWLHIVIIFGAFFLLAFRKLWMPGLLGIVPLF